MLDHRRLEIIAIDHGQPDRCGPVPAEADHGLDRSVAARFEPVLIALDLPQVSQRGLSGRVIDRVRGAGAIQGHRGLEPIILGDCPWGYRDPGDRRVPSGVVARRSPRRAQDQPDPERAAA